MKIHWLSDWNGYEVGFPEVSVVGFYKSADSPDKYFYLNAETGDILEEWEEVEEYEE